MFNKAIHLKPREGVRIACFVNVWRKWRNHLAKQSVHENAMKVPLRCYISLTHPVSKDNDIWPFIPHTQPNEFPFYGQLGWTSDKSNIELRMLRTTSLIPIQNAKRLFDAFHSAPTGFDAKILLNCPTWSTIELAKKDAARWLMRSNLGYTRWILTYRTVGSNGATRAASIVAPPDARSNTCCSRRVNGRQTYDIPERRTDLCVCDVVRSTCEGVRGLIPSLSDKDCNGAYREIVPNSDRSRKSGYHFDIINTNRWTQGKCQWSLTNPGTGESTPAEILKPSVV